MRHWLLILMIALLPLRGWASDTMALSDWGAPVRAQAVAPCHGQQAESSPMNSLDMPGGHQANTEPAMAHGHAADDDSASHTACTACDLCNGPAMTPAVQSARSTVPAIGHGATACEHFASAVPQRGSKPPIA
jgi:hypothetical protein